MELYNVTMCSVKINTVNKTFKYEKMTCKQHIITEDFYIRFSENPGIDFILQNGPYRPKMSFD